MALRRTQPDPRRGADPGCRARRDRRAATPRHGGSGRHQQHARHRAAAQRRPAHGGRVLRAAPLPGSATADAVLEDAARRRARRGAEPARPRLACAACAVLGVATRCFARCARGCDAEPLARTSVHLAESPEEIELLTRGSGPLRDLLQDVGAWDDGWTPPGCGPVEYLDRLRFPRLRARWSCTACRWIGPISIGLRARERRSSPARAATGTSAWVTRRSSASTPRACRWRSAPTAWRAYRTSTCSASWRRCARLRRLCRPRRLLESATLVGARALGLRDAARVDRSQASDAALIAVEVPPGVDDVEEYLVGGIEPAQVRWAMPRRIAPGPGANSWNSK